MKQYKWWLPLPKLRLTVRNVEKVICAVLAIAAFANIFLVKIVHEVNDIQIGLSTSSAILCVLLAYRIFDKTKISVWQIYVSLMSASVWYIQIAEITLAEGLSGWTKTRQGFMYLSFAILSTFLYYMQRIVRDTRMEAFIQNDP